MSKEDITSHVQFRPEQEKELLLVVGSMNKYSHGMISFGGLNLSALNEVNHVIENQLLAKLNQDKANKKKAMDFFKSLENEVLSFVKKHQGQDGISSDHGLGINQIFSAQIKQFKLEEKLNPLFQEDHTHKNTTDPSSLKGGSWQSDSWQGNQQTIKSDSTVHQKEDEFENIDSVMKANRLNRVIRMPNAIHNSKDKTIWEIITLRYRKVFR
jgi:hypothetical protein